ncbi:MAG: hypothetical protein ACK4TA_25150 [Saprospiraceae bacterium]
MKRILWITVIMFMVLYHGFSQEVAPFQLKDQKGITISKKSLPLLTGKTWTTYKQYYANKDEASVYAGSFMAFKFSPDGKFNGTAGNRSLSGNWSIENKRLLKLVINEVNEIDQEVKIGGAYAVYKLTNEELVLVKNLTSDLSMRIIYYCKGSKTSVLAESPKNAGASSVNQVDKKALEEAQKKREQQVLINEIETEAQLRGIKLKDKLDKMDMKSLQSLKNQIVSGEYQKVKTKT